MVPFVQKLAAARRVLVAGCGGGFDVYTAMPVATNLLAQGSEVAFANLSFSDLPRSGSGRLDPVTWRIETSAAELPYFPEKWLAEWLDRRMGIAPPVYAFARTGVEPLRVAFRMLLDLHEFDLVILADGGTDSLIFGDEPGLGTVVEDAVSIVAAVGAAGDRAVLSILGFGVDHFHGVSHYAFLENAARMIRGGGYLGSFGLMRGTPEAEAFLDLVDYANQRQPRHRSIVCNSIASALRGEFGDYHATDRTAGTELFINPLMTQHWTFAASSVAAAMDFADALNGTRTFAEASNAVQRRREALEPRARKPLPL